MLSELSRDRIRRVRATSANADPLSLRRGLERELGTATLQQGLLPAAAIVCVRRIRVVAARSAPLGDSLADAIGRLVPAMIRPLHGPVPANAEAVVFFDEAELLACLARDWLRGDGEAWWWQNLFATPLGGELVRQAFVAAPQFVPVAIDLLDRMRLAAAFARALPAAGCEALGAAVAAAFAVTGWACSPSMSVAPGGERAFAGGAPRASSVDAARLEATFGDAASVAVLAELSAPARTLVGLALALRRAPALARRPGFVASLREASPPLATGDVLVQGKPASETRAHALPAPEATSTPMLRSLAPATASGARAVDLPVAIPAASAEREGAVAALERDPDSPIAEGWSVGYPLSPPTPERSATPDRDPAIFRLPPRPAAFVASEFAGLLYLMNVALYLELYGDFTQPARPGLALHPGDFLALGGERICGPALLDDPIWTLLAAFSGRGEDERPGLAFVAPGGETVERWLDKLVPAMEVRVALALGVEPGTALRFLSRRPGRLALSPTRLEAVFPLATHPLAIRIAGLDRDPGWVPAAGRAIEFHYE